ncbi:MAG: stage II sporulation protein D [Oscillospiraceae bacterium]|nr:stage II sporulation protein D [Oscillospiraceae bacterium]
MKKILLIIAIVIFTTLLLPLAIVWLVGLGGEGNTGSLESGSVSVYVADAGRAEDMGINQYLKCVVAAEMPADFETEALKAQAVAARTYLYSRIEDAANGNIAEGHNGAAICTDSTHCQAYISEEERRESWGAAADEKWDKISAAVEETSGRIMTYNGNIISAVFHSTSSGNTEAAVDVWGSDIPYLQSVESEGDRLSPKYSSSLTLSEEEFKNKIDENISGTDWTGELVSNINRSNAGGIISLDVGGVNIKGSELRNIFSLSSANVELTRENGNITMSVKGYGHGVGMSQYGANYLASQGMGYEEILKYYYTGVDIETR